MDGTSQNGSGGVNGNSRITRAELFEQEKARIIESCFNKRDTDGSIYESYITHIRIEEDATYPSTPPPPNTGTDSKKQRVIIVAVRKSGRVQLHKARENANGSFSKGKTWVMDDLTAIRSYNGLVPESPEEEQDKLWAGNVGFTVTLGKPYYWKANTQKEKQFFITSLVKIFIKYTGGRVPELLGFDLREREQILGVTATTERSAPPAQSGSAGSALSDRPPLGRERSRDPVSRNDLDGATPRLQPPLKSNGASLVSPTVRRPMRPLRGDSPNGIADLTLPSNSSRSQSSPKRLALNYSQEPLSRGDDAASLPPRSRGGINGTPTAAGRFQNRSMTPELQLSVTPDGSPSSVREAANESRQIPAPLSILPERRRPPLPNLIDSRQLNTGTNDKNFPPPLSSPVFRTEGSRPRTGSNDRTKLNDSDPMDIPRDPPINSDANEQTSSSVNLPPISSVQLSVAPRTDDNSSESETMRPGLGPMIRAKTDVAGAFLRGTKVTNAFNAFKPRAGGAAERMREAQAKSVEEPDGITGLIATPSLIRPTSESSLMATASKSLEVKSETETSDDVPEVKITVPKLNGPSSASGSVASPHTSGGPSEKSKAREVKRVKLPAEAMARELASIGVDPITLCGRAADLVSAWEQFGWVGEGVRTKNIDQMKDEVDRELNRIQAGGWLNRLEEEDERIEAIKKGFDSVIDECDELDGLLTLYLVELSTLNEDVAYIEAQSQGLQVQTANQKLLQAELQSLLQTISISSDQLLSLQEASLESSRGLGKIESSLVILFKAMLTIEPSLGLSGSRRKSEDGSLISGKPGAYGNSEIGSMRVLQEKKDGYRNEISNFLRRLMPFMQVKFSAAVDQTRQALERERGNNLRRSSSRIKLDSANHDLARSLLWKYSPLMLFTREVDRVEWENLIKLYEKASMPLYKEEFREEAYALKLSARKPHGDESEVLFTSQVEKQAEGLATTARKLTVKRSQTLAKSLRSPIGDNNNKSSLEKSSGQEPYEVFEEAIRQMVSIMSMEQNFIVDFFHISSLEQLDFPDTVATASPDDRRGGDLGKSRVMDPNRDLASLVIQSMEEIYSFFPRELQMLVDWGLQADPIQGVGIIAALERKILELEETCQEYLNRTFQKLHNQLMSSFNKFLDEQIRAIEDTKVKIKKRKGVIGFIKIFPSFSNALEKKLSKAFDLEIRDTINNAYSRINKTMFESLKVIARENPGAQIATSDPEDKEALNYEILLMQNMNYYLEEVDDSLGISVLEEWREKAAQEMDEHMRLYLAAVIRRPLGKLLDFLESTESMMLARQPGEPVSKISGMPSHSKTTFQKVLAGYDSKEIKRGIETLRKRVEKHFGDEHELGTSNGGLVTQVLQGCEHYYEKVEDRILTISRDVYDGDVIAEWSRADVSAAFRK